MKTLALVALATTLTAGAALAQSSSHAGGPLGEWSRRNGVDPWGTTYGPPGVVIGGPGVILGGPGVGAYDPEETGTVYVEPPRMRTAPGMIPGTPPSGKGNYSGGPRGEMERRW